jgi:hypothetical protein
MITASNIPTARDGYRAALKAFAAAEPEGPDDALLPSLYRLNAVYYLDAYLPEGVCESAVRDAAMALEQTAAALAAPSCDLQRPVGRQDRAIRRLLATLECRGSSPSAIVAAQHMLEIESELDPAEAVGVVKGLQHRLARIPIDRHVRAALASARRDGLAYPAAANDRPQRAGETNAWAECLPVRPAEVLRRALASGLRFGALLDALTIAAAQSQAAHAADHPLIAAHAVRRLSDLTGSPALGLWLAVALRLGPGGESPASRASTDARDLALAAVRSGDGGLIQLAEAALMEREALPADLEAMPLAALSRAIERASPVTAATDDGWHAKEAI